jgi:uncharacterized membrane protein YtjA (UPF0391 family)
MAVLDRRAGRGALGFFLIEGAAAVVAKWCFVIFLVVFVVSLITGRRVVGA